jgi:MSHA pilin protein MshD
VSKRQPGREAGVNLIELLISIVIISIACTGVLLIYAQTVRFSADPMVQTQALAVAEAYLDEILARPITDPSGGDTGGAEPGETRPTYDDVNDYDNLSNAPPQDQNGNGQPELSGYQVDVDVTANVAVNGFAMSRVDVRVRYGVQVDFTLSGFRAP